MKIGLISDTHDNVFAIKAAVEILKEKKPDLIIHLGDIVAPITVLYFNGLKIKFLKGNNDGDVPNLTKKIESIECEFFIDKLELDFGGKKIAAVHGHKVDQMDELIASGRYDYVFQGHTHELKDEKVGKTRVINPGGLYMAVEKKTIAVLDLETDDLEVIEVN